MARQARQESGTGIYHVMMRGINHQNLFESPEDYYYFIITLDRVRFQYNDEGKRCGRNCVYFAYCLMSNHVHLLLREKAESASATIKRIASSYVYYYNRKYGRDGHLFKERFKSEPVNDMGYFLTLMRYIHQNPVKAGLVGRVADYPFSSWGEYDGRVEPAFQICDTDVVLKRTPLEELQAWVDDPLGDDVACLEMEGSSRVRPSDEQVWQTIQARLGVSNMADFQQLAAEDKRRVIRLLKAQGASNRQLERLTGTGRGFIQRC